MIVREKTSGFDTYSHIAHFRLITALLAELHQLFRILVNWWTVFLYDSMKFLSMVSAVYDFLVLFYLYYVAVICLSCEI